MTTKYRKTKLKKMPSLKKILSGVGVFIILNLVLLFIGPKHGKPLLQEYPTQPIIAVLVSLVYTSLAFAFAIFIWIPLKSWFMKITS